MKALVIKGWTGKKITNKKANLFDILLQMRIHWAPVCSQIKPLFNSDSVVLPAHGQKHTEEINLYFVKINTQSTRRNKIISNYHP